jgi:hypothetical protein
LARASGALLVSGASASHALPLLVLKKYYRAVFEEKEATLEDVFVSFSPAARVLTGLEFWRECLRRGERLRGLQLLRQDAAYRGLLSRRLHFRIDSSPTMEAIQKQYPSVKRNASYFGVDNRLLMILAMILLQIGRLGTIFVDVLPLYFV